MTDEDDIELEPSERDLEVMPASEWPLREKLRGVPKVMWFLGVLLVFVMYHVSHLPPETEPLAPYKCSAAIAVAIYSDGTPRSVDGAK